MLVTQLTWEMFLTQVKEAYPNAYTQAGLKLIWDRYNKFAESGAVLYHILLEPATVDETYQELSLITFAQINSLEWVQCGTSKTEIQNFLGENRFVGFTEDNTVVFKR